MSMTEIRIGHAFMRAASTPLSVQLRDFRPSVSFLQGLGEILPFLQ